MSGTEGYYEKNPFRQLRGGGCYICEGHAGTASLRNAKIPICKSCAKAYGMAGPEKIVLPPEPAPPKPEELAVDEWDFSSASMIPRTGWFPLP